MGKAIVDLFYIKKSDLAFGFLCLGILWAYWSSLMPWFMWPLVKVNILIPSVFIIIAFYISYYFSTENIFDRKDYGLPSIMALTTLLFMRIVNGTNIIGIIEGTLTTLIFFSLFKLNINHLRRIIRIVCITTAGFLTISLTAFFLYLFGVPLPSSTISNEELMYTFQNYYLFMIDDRAFFAFFPRFHSVFLEPGHLGTATTLLLLTQVGQWKKWYNIVLIITTLITFSLAAYVLFVMVLFAAAWMQHKKFFLKLFAIIVLLIGVGFGAFLYDQGDNLLYSLIIERLEMSEDGRMAGDNRVTQDFEAVYDDYLESTDILVGREYKLEDFGPGNAGYRVFIYDYGFICLFLVIVFFLSAVLSSRNRRAVVSMFVIGSAEFLVRSIPFTFYFFIPMYALPFIQEPKTKEPEAEEMETEEIETSTLKPSEL